MKYIKIFLASSIVELETERLQLSDFIRSLNDSYVRRDVYFELIICENITNAVYKERKQQQYNREISDSRYFYVIFGENAGAYTVEEFNIALEAFRKNGAPKIYTYFRRLSEDVKPSESVKRFMDQLNDELGHYYSVFRDVDAVKLNMLLELTRDQEVGGTVTLEDGMAKLNGNPVVSMEEVPIYRKNAAIMELSDRRARLEETYLELTERLAQSPEDPLLLQLAEENRQSWNHLSEQLHTMEKELLSFYTGVTEKRQLGCQMNWREKKAIALTDQGDYEGAKKVLRDAQWTQEIRRAEEMLDNMLGRVKEYISGKRMLIETIKATGVTEETEREILACYEEITELAKKYNVEMLVLYDYILFLMHHNRHEAAIGISRQLDHYYSYSRDNEKARANNKYILACMLYKTNALEEAEKLHLQARQIRRTLCGSGDPNNIARYAVSCYQLGYLWFRMGNIGQAREIYTEGIGILKELVRTEPMYNTNLALILNNMAVLLQHQKDYDRAEECFAEAVGISRELALDGTTSSLGFLAMEMLNYAKFLLEARDWNAAEPLYRETVDLYRQLCLRDIKFRPDLALAKYYQAVALETVDEEAALQQHLQVLQLRRELALRNPEARKADLGYSNFAVGRLLQRRDPQGAKEYLQQAKGLIAELYEKAPQKYAQLYQQICQAYCP